MVMGFLFGGFVCSDYLFKLLLIGDSYMGKLCLLLSLAVNLIFFNDIFFLVNLFSGSVSWWICEVHFLVLVYFKMILDSYVDSYISMIGVNFVSLSLFSLNCWLLLLLLLLLLFSPLSVYLDEIYLLV
jgi:hypothetical protein